MDLIISITLLVFELGFVPSLAPKISLKWVFFFFFLSFRIIEEPTHLTLVFIFFQVELCFVWWYGEISYERAQLVWDGKEWGARRREHIVCTSESERSDGVELKAICMIFNWIESKRGSLYAYNCYWEKILVSMSRQVVMARGSPKSGPTPQKIRTSLVLDTTHFSWPSCEVCLLSFYLLLDVSKLVKETSAQL